MSSSTRRRTAWVATATLSAASLLAICGIQPAMAATGAAAALPATVTVPAAAPLAAAVPDGEYTQRFLTMYNKIKNPANGYFSPQGIPYHSVETLIVEAPDHGHETTSEAFSYWLWLEAAYGQVTRDWAPFNNAWDDAREVHHPDARGPADELRSTTRRARRRTRRSPTARASTRRSWTAASPSGRTRSRPS